MQRKGDYEMYEGIESSIKTRIPNSLGNYYAFAHNSEVRALICNVLVTC